jgi:hypothetical protein
MNVMVDPENQYIKSFAMIETTFLFLDAQSLRLSSSCDEEADSKQKNATLKDA